MSKHHVLVAFILSHALVARADQHYDQHYDHHPATTDGGALGSDGWLLWFLLVAFVLGSIACCVVPPVVHASPRPHRDYYDDDT